MLMLTSCAPVGHNSTASSIGTCVHDISARQIEYPDGQIRKSETYWCKQSNGVICHHAICDDDASITTTDCTEHFDDLD